VNRVALTRFSMENVAWVSGGSLVIPRRPFGGGKIGSRKMSVRMAVEGVPSNGIQERSTVLEVAGHRLTAVSVGGWETCIQFPSYRLAIDIGRCPPTAINMETVAITHAHMDHIGGIGMHVATRTMRKMKPPTYLVPKAILSDFRSLIQAFEKLDGSNWNYKIQEMMPHETTHSLGKGRILKSFPTYHTVPSQGYLLYSQRKKLLDEYAELSSEEISRLRKSGVQVSQPVLSPEIAVPGDSTIQVLEEEEDVRNASLLVIEVTFLDDSSSPEDARRFGHIHIEDVIEVWLFVSLFGLESYCKEEEALGRRVLNASIFYVSAGCS